MQETLFGTVHLGPNLCTTGVSNLDHLEGILTVLSSGSSIGCVDNFLDWFWFQFDTNRSYSKHLLMGKPTSIWEDLQRIETMYYHINCHGSTQAENCSDEIGISLNPVKSIGPTP